MHAVGPKGEGGLDDATGAGGAGGASMKQSSGVVDLGNHWSAPHSGIVQLTPMLLAVSLRPVRHTASASDSTLSPRSCCF